MDHYLDFLDICAILLGIMFTIAKLDAQGRSPESFPQVAPADFERWRNWTVSIYRLGSSMCFLRVLFHQGWVLYLSRQTLHGPFAPAALRYPALALDRVVLGSLVSPFVRGGRARALRRELGIVLAPLSPQQAAAVAPEDEASAAAKDE